MFDKTGFVKRGKTRWVLPGILWHAREGGRLASRSVCRLCLGQGYALVDKRLFLPEVWFGEAMLPAPDDVPRPAEVTFRANRLAAAMSAGIAHEGLLPFKYVVADCLYGNSPGLSRRRGRVCRCDDVGRDSCGAPAAGSSAPKRRTRRTSIKETSRSNACGRRPHTASSSVAAVAASLPRSSWYQRMVSEARKGRLHSVCPLTRAPRCARMVCPIAPSGW